MKVLNLILAILISVIGYSQTLFNENIGTATGTIAITANSFQNSSLTFGGNADTRSTTISNGYVGASGGRNVFFVNTNGTNFLISGINTSNLFGIGLSFGQFKSTTASSNELIVEVSSDGISYTSLTYSRPTGTGTALWKLIIPTGAIPVTSNLRLRFRNTSTTAQFRIDDIKLTYESALPIELLSFDGISKESYNTLNWITASESNNDYFTLEKTNDGKTFNIVGTVNGAGNSNTKINYSFDDTNVNGEISYYRLKQTDFDGNYKYSDIISINNTKPTGKVLVKVVNMLGQEILYDYKGVLIFYYSDGSIVKRFFQ